IKGQQRRRKLQETQIDDKYCASDERVSNQRPATKEHQRRRKRKWMTNILDINPNINIILFGENEYEKIRKRKLIIQGLVSASLEKESMMERYFKNKAFEALGYEKIWTLRCEAVAEWEEL
ncbi:20988_t:CDS:2, partial [Gigaspora rosea]